MILVTGGSGQVAQALAAASPRVQVVGRPRFDFDDPASLVAVLEAARPSLVVNAAAYTAVDRAESEPEAAARANATGPGVVARWCAAAGVTLIHLSTDYVFDGRKGVPYVETDPTSPTGVYGATKLAGEQAVLAAGGQAVVLRTSWVYAATGRNFVLTMLNLARRTNAVRVVADQVGCPTAAADLAGAVLAVAERIEAGWQDGFQGVLHACGAGETSWHGLAEAVFEAAARHGLARPQVQAIATPDYPTAARRPPDSRLDTTRLARLFGVTLPPWRESVARTVDRVFAT